MSHDYITDITLEKAWSFSHKYEIMNYKNNLKNIFPMVICKFHTENNWCNLQKFILVTFMVFLLLLLDLLIILRNGFVGILSKLTSEIRV